ncbi:hypothetical protein PR048_024019 [Dryococelus australis]|uniref:Uncharacterized protein n=1 Tax=Dryococelus australis TaxID=614101 RepID=A0ABQ9GVQ2_9NEOP|nr:hypothetical protein PR048_024019 [Dryococelus australis]
MGGLEEHFALVQRRMNLAEVVFDEFSVRRTCNTVVAHLTHIRGGPGFVSWSGHSDFGFQWLSEITSGECWDGSRTKAGADSFPNPSSFATCIVAVDKTEVLKGKLVLAHCCTLSVHAAGANNQSGAKGKLNIFRPFTSEQQGTRYTRPVPSASELRFSGRKYGKYYINPRWLMGICLKKGVDNAYHGDDGVVRSAVEADHGDVVEAVHVEAAVVQSVGAVAHSAAAAAAEDRSSRTSSSRSCMTSFLKKRNEPGPSNAECELRRMCTVKPSPKGMGRKKDRNPALWKKNVNKKCKYSTKCLPSLPDCKHNGRKDFHCSQLTLHDVRKLHEMFLTQEHRHFCIFSRFQIKEFGGCAEFILKPEHVSKGNMVVVIDHINMKRKKLLLSLLCHQKSHYCRNSNTKKQYLNNNLTTKKCHSMYNNACPADALRVEYEYFRNVFVTEYNISFDSPAVDKCSKCLQYEEWLKTNRNDRSMEIEFEAHKRCANAFYKLLKTDPENSITLSFDCEKKNLVLPKIPDQATYYSRQLYLFNFAMVEGTSKDRQPADKAHIYTWTEADGHKGSSEKTFDVYHQLNNTNLRNYEIVPLFADSCGGGGETKTHP